ncbi:hypothetical protein SB769_37320, partial [Burkholderia sp. SIMBA_024]
TRSERAPLAEWPSVFQTRLAGNWSRRVLQAAHRRLLMQASFQPAASLRPLPADGANASRNKPNPLTADSGAATLNDPDNAPAVRL